MASMARASPALTQMAHPGDELRHGCHLKIEAFAAESDDRESPACSAGATRILVGARSYSSHRNPSDCTISIPNPSPRSAGRVPDLDRYRIYA
jgi:hypothetical protein